MHHENGKQNLIACKFARNVSRESRSIAGRYHGHNQSCLAVKNERRRMYTLWLSNDSEVVVGGTSLS